MIIFRYGDSTQFEKMKADQAKSGLSAMNLEEEEIQRICDKYHCRCERINDYADLDRIEFYVGSFLNRYSLYRTYVDSEFNVESFVKEAELELDKYDIAKIDEVNLKYKS